MRKIYSLFLVLLALSSCTISIEDELLPPERQGFDKICTVNNEYGELSYQFQDSVLYVTERVQEHIRLIDDSTFVYDASTPKEWRPYVGARLAASCSHTIPFGLNNRVVSVTPTGEGLLVHTERTTIEDVYKTLEYEFDFDSNLPIVPVGADIDTLKAYGFELRPDSTLLYWGNYDSQRSRALGLHSPSSRAKDGEDVDTDETNKIVGFSVDTRDGWLDIKKGYRQTKDIWYDFQKYLNEIVEDHKNKLREKPNVLKSLTDNLYLALNVDLSSINHVHFKRKESGYPYIEESWTDSYHKLDLGIEFGYEKTKSVGSINRSNIGKNVAWRVDHSANKDEKMSYEAISDVYTAGFVMKGDKEKKSLAEWDYKFFFFTIGPVPFNFSFHGGLDLSLSVNAFVAGNFSLTTGTSRKGYRLFKYAKGEEKISIDQDNITSGSISFNNASVEGNVGVTLTGRAAIGLEVGGSIGSDVGYSIEAGAKASIFSNPHYDPYGNFVMNPDGKFNVYFHGTGDVHIYIAPFGLKLFDKSVFKFAPKKFFDVTYGIEPTIPYVVTVSRNGLHGDTKCISATYELEHLGLVRFLTPKALTPQMRLYFGNYSKESKDYVVMTPVQSDLETPAPPSQTIDTKQYDFLWEGEMPPGYVHATVVPAYFTLDDPEGSEPYLFPQYAKVVETGTPSISIVSDYTRQTYGGPYERNEFDFTDDGSAIESFADVNASNSGYGASVDPADLSFFKVMTTAIVYNGTYIKSWGLKLQVYDSKGNRYMSKKIPMSPNTTGVYTLVADFYSNWNAGKATYPDDHYFTFTPYWTDAGGVHHTGTTSSKRMLQFRAEDTTPGKDQSTYGKMTEKNIK